MPRRLVLTLAFFGLIAFLTPAPRSWAQGKKAWGSGGFGLSMGDSNAMFDRLAKGRGYLLISETWMLKKPLADFAQEKGITNGQITREQFAVFNEQMKAKMMGLKSPSGGFPPKEGFSFPKEGPRGAPTGVGGSNPAEMMGQWAEAEFMRRDSNGDHLLNTDEMPRTLRENLARWDVNKDNLIDAQEYRAFFLARVTGSNDRESPANPVTTILIEEDLEKRPVVYRAGKLPKELPRWFEELDTDKDGQVALFEWRKGDKSFADFKLWDRNDDGLITAEEALRQQNLQNSSTPNAATTVINSTNDETSRRGGFGGFGRSKKKF